MIYPVVVHLVKENEHKAQQVLESHIAMMEALGRAIAKRDSDTGAHNYRVAWLAARTAEALGLQGAAIPLSARIFAVADVFDALSSRRPYKEPLPFEKVMAILHEGRGSHFDLSVLDTFTRLAPQLRAQLQGLDEAATRRLMTDMVQRHFDVLV